MNDTLKTKYKPDQYKGFEDFINFKNNELYDKKYQIMIVINKYIQILKNIKKMDLR